MRIVDVPTSGIYFQRGAITQLVFQIIDRNTGLPVQLQTASALTISIRYPDDSTSRDFVASLYTDGSDGRIVYTTHNDGDSDIDLTQVGLYEIQGRGTIGGVQLPESSEDDFYVLANADDDGTQPVAYTSSAFVLFDENNARWAITIDTDGDLVKTKQPTGPANALTLHNLVLKDDTGIYWTVTIDATGELHIDQGGTFETAIDRITLIDSAAVTWLITVSEAGVLTPE